MKEPMTDEKAVDVLARRDGWEKKWTTGVRKLSWWKGLLSTLPDYLHSRDALRPVILTLSPEEQRRLGTMIEVSYMDDNYEGPLLIYTINLPADQLARMVAEVLSEGE